MRLRSIHIKGFKSFPVDTTLYFNEKVTGVVGPNGSGKSNIVDAIRWVLGEQKTTELRLGAMSDVLFNGTKKRKKSGLAQVTLNFDNTKNIIPTEYNQVAISRLLFRNGESEFRINDVPCRLKDIRSLFVDTGIGPDSYAIIALNMVDDILTDNDGSRRRMFEQASGISKYKKRKKETLNKLKGTNADLDRVEDLLFEIANNLKELERQARRVERFIKIKDQYKSVTIELNLRQYDDIIKNRTKIKEQIEVELEKHRVSSQNMNKLEVKLQVEKKSILENEQELSDFQKEINQLLDEIRKTENEKQLALQQTGFKKQKLDSIISSDRSLKLDIDQLTNKNDGLIQKLEQEKIVHQKLSVSYKEAVARYDAIKEKYELLKADHDALTNEKQKLEDLKFQLEKRIAVAENQIERLIQDSDKKSHTLKEIGELKRSLNESNREKGFQIEVLNKKLENLYESSQKRKETLKTLSEQKEALKQDKEKLQRKLDARKNEYDLIRSMVDSLEGFPESIKFLNKSWQANAVLLTDVIYAPEEYKLAIESFLEPYLNFYVVEEQEDAYDAISLLHGSQKGKANFFILDRISSHPPITNDKDGMIRAIEVLEFEDKYYNLLAGLLHNVYITDLDYKDIEIYYEDKQSEPYYFLNKHGSFSSTPNSISGGSVGLFEGKKLGRKKNLEKLNNSIYKLQSEIDKFEKKIVRVHEEINFLESNKDELEIEQFKRSLEAARLDMVEHEMKLAGHDKNLKELTGEIDRNRLEIDTLKKLVKDSAEEIEKIDKRYSGLFRGDKHDDQSIQQLTEQLSKLAEEKNGQNIELIRHQNLIDSIVNDTQYAENDLLRMQEQLKKNEIERENIDESLVELEDSLVEMDKTLVSKYEVKKASENKLTDIEKQFYQKRGLITELEEAVSKIRRENHQTQFLVNELKEKLHDQDFRVQSVIERLKIEFNLDIAALEDFERTDMPIYDLEEKHDLLKRKMENFGEVNTMAVEAYNEMKERFETIEKQKEDIVKSQETLLTTIEEIETIATERYLETFEVVKSHFKDVFTGLFKTGDTCDILLEDPENPLESRIEIVAKPKGKRPKTLNQLSGGEKTLTAIALLFSLYLYKPAPFCIFDEVDAPLDDANIQKFNRIVKDFSKDSQFIIITHNKSTMAAVDVLYGVFMQEMGVSEVAAVDFREYEPITPVMSSN
jgi:chromosome segregation protein